MTELNKAGLSKQIVDSYLEGAREELGIGTDEPVLTEAEVNEIKGLAGGEEGYQSLMEWAGQNLPKKMPRTMMMS